MKTWQEAPMSDRAAWRAYPSIQRWGAGLIGMTGLTPEQAANRHETLFAFCARHGIDPETMAEECRKGDARGADRVARREHYLRIASATPENLVVQSFLVHNGVNVFGDLICMPSTRESLVAEQGAQWVRTSEAPSFLHETRE